MEFLQIGNTDLLASRIGFGCWAIGGHGYGAVDDETSIDAIHAALESGVNLFDTANVYGFGHSENVLGRAIRESRDEVIVATKFGVTWDDAGRTRKDCSPQQIVESLEGSLRRLGLETIPLFQLHWHDGRTPVEEIVETLLRCQRAGKIQHLGFCNMSLQVWGASAEQFVSSQLRHGLNAPYSETEFAELQEHKIAAFAYDVLSRGLLSGKYDANATFSEGDTRAREPDFADRLQQNLSLVTVLRERAKSYGKSPAQLAIRWALQTPGISSALVGIKTRAQAIENVGATGWEMTKSDWSDLGRLRITPGQASQ